MPSMNLEDYCDDNRDEDVRVLNWHPDQSQDWDQYSAPALGNVRGVTRRHIAKKNAVAFGNTQTSDVACGAGETAFSNTKDGGGFCSAKETLLQSGGGVGESVAQHDMFSAHRGLYVLVPLTLLLSVLMCMSLASSASMGKDVLASTGAPWRQPVCDVGVFLKSQGARLATDSAALAVALRNDTNATEPLDALNLGIVMVQGSTDNLRGLVSGAVGGQDSAGVRALLIVDLFAHGGSSDRYIKGWHDGGVFARAQMLRAYCEEARSRRAAVMVALDKWGDVVDPLAAGPACHGVSDAWDGADAEERLLALEAGYDRYPYNPAYVGSSMQQLGKQTVNLFVSVGYPFTYEAVAWFLTFAKRAGDARSTKLVMYGFASPVEVVSTVSAACDRLWAPSGVADITKDVPCSGVAPAGKRYFMLSFQGNLQSDEVARACGGLVH